MKRGKYMMRLRDPPIMNMKRAKKRFWKVESYQN